MYLKGDWPEFAHTFGLPSWNSNFHPCPCCSASADELGDRRCYKCLSGPHTDKTFEDYDRACAECEFKVVVNTRVDLHRLAGSPHYDQRSPGHHGRTLSVALPSLGLLEGDRMEPSAKVVDVGHLESVTTFPLWLTFWRQANETSARHGSPLFSLERETHISPCSIALASLHGLHWEVDKDLLHDECRGSAHSCECLESWHDRHWEEFAQDVAATPQGGTASVVSNATCGASRRSLSTNFRT